MHFAAHTPGPLVQVWTFSSECIAELAGHTALVYCAAAAVDGTIASGSEDNSVKLWHADGTCLQASVNERGRRQGRGGPGTGVGPGLDPGTRMGDPIMGPARRQV